MDKEKLFKNQVRDGEKVVAVYEAGKGYIRYHLCMFLLIGLFPLFLPFMWTFSIFWMLGLGRISKKNYHVCLTDSRLIVRHGVFGLHYKEYDVENFGNVRTAQLSFERGGNSNSCRIRIERTTFHLNSQGQQETGAISISTIKNGYDLAKRIMSAKKNNKSVVVEIKK